MDADEATIHGYYAALKDVEFEFLAMAAQRLARSSEWFPKTSEWRTMAVKIEAELRDAQRALLRRLPEPLCLECSDTGWAADQRAGRVQNLAVPNRENGGVDTVSIVASPGHRQCECQQLRRLELLGRRPLPALPEAPPADQTEQPLKPGEAVSLLRGLEQRTGRRMGMRSMSADRKGESRQLMAAGHVDPHQVPPELRSTRAAELSRTTLGRVPSRELSRFPSLLTPAEVGTLLRTSRKAIYAMIERGQLPGVVRIGRRVLIREADLLDWLRQKSTPSLER